MKALLTLSPELRDKIIASLALLAVTLIARWVAVRIVRRSTTDVVVRYRWRKISQYVAVLIVVYGLGRIWLNGLHSLTTMIGLLAAGLAVSLQEPISNVAGWLHILTRRPFEVGDRIQVGEVKGDVIDQRVFAFTLLEIGNWVDAEQSTGRIVHVPNARVFREPVASYSRGFRYIWVELVTLVTFESDWRAAKALIAEIGDKLGAHVEDEARRQVDDAADRYMIRFTHLTPTVYTRVVDSGIQLTLRLLCLPQERRNVEERVWESILDAFASRADIDFAYPTQRFYDNAAEGKRTKPPG